MTLVERINQRMNADEVIDLLGLDVCIIVDALLEEILERREKFEEYLEDIA